MLGGCAGPLEAVTACADGWATTSPAAFDHDFTHGKELAHCSPEMIEQYRIRSHSTAVTTFEGNYD